ncbi:ribonuclease P protein subunit p14-like [Ixodes scapularis]|uniref:ribonuclease P protein subunit p14-like n=1 Tax=Ixodes scapularis TaxID=6945 RepID=UPI001C392D36|nr:ribonuclease P protein subunit p14-like [Ixodes scapularis]
MMLKRTVHRCETVYLDVSLEFEGNPDFEFDSKIFKYAIVTALRRLFGEVGASIQVDVLRYREHDRRAYLRTSIKNLVKVWSSLTLCTSYDGKPCTFRIFKVSCSLASLSVCSSHYEHKPVRQTTDID